MTTTVIVKAHCADSKAVSINISDAHGESNEVLQNGEEREFYAYDERKISINEFDKTEDHGVPDSADEVSGD